MIPGSAGAASAHSAQTATLKGLAQQLLLSDQTAEALAAGEAVVASLAPDDQHRRSVAAVREAVEFHSHIPTALLEERSIAARAGSRRALRTISSYFSRTWRS